MADRFRNGDPTNDSGGLPQGTDNGHSEGESGFDPTGKGWYHGGDLAGLRSRLGYIDDLGTTAIWLTPSFKNKAVQDNNGFPSAGYHGYWVTDFTQIDPHFGTNRELTDLIRDAHARGSRSTSTSSPTTPRTSSATRRARRRATARRTSSRTGRPPVRRSTIATTRTGPRRSRHCSRRGRPCPGGAGDELRVPPVRSGGRGDGQGARLAQRRQRLPQPGQHDFAGENSTYGDFFGLDDLFTEQPRVVDGMTDIYKRWIRDFEIDGFRMDTMKHVNDEFWQKFAAGDHGVRPPAGQEDFYMFGEVAEDTSRPITSHYRRTTTSRASSTSRSRRRRRASRPVRHRPTSCGPSSATTTGTPTRTPTSTSSPRSSGTTTRGASGCSCATRTPARARTSCSRVTSSPTS